MRLSSLFALLTIASFACAQKNLALSVDLPNGVKSYSWDSGLPHSFSVNPSAAGYSVSEWSASDEMTTGGLAWKGVEIAALHCYQKKCVQLSPGHYSATFTIKGADPTTLSGKLREAEAEDAISRCRVLRTPCQTRQIVDLMDIVVVDFIGLRDGKPHGKPRKATYSVEWFASRSDLRAEYLASGIATSR